MVTIPSLWLAILLSAVLVWIASALIWSTIHRSDYKGLPDEEAARKALKPQNLEPGFYNIPNVKSASEIKNPEVVKKFEEGPVGFLTILPNGVPSIGKNMGLSVIYYLVVGVFVAYMTSRTLTPGADYLAVFRVSGTIAWGAYGLAVVPDAIWFGRPWSQVGKILFDALIYGMLTGGVFGGSGREFIDDMEFMEM